MNQPTSLTGSHWSQVSKKTQKEAVITRWWQSQYILKHINRKVSSKEIKGFSAGLVDRVNTLSGDRLPFARGISVGCGSGQKEMTLIRQGIVDHFELYELSDYRIEMGQELAKKFNIEDKVNFNLGNAFELANTPNSFDFVHWNNSLHHMLDVDAAIKWSHSVLKKGGMFYMDDYVGNNYLQFSEKTSEIASKIRNILPDKYLVHPRNSNALVSTIVKPGSKEGIIASDPSEAADSEKIISCVVKYFPEAEISFNGGAVYYPALNDIIGNFDEVSDKFVLDLLMIIDDLLAQLGENYYATALAFK